MPNRTKIRQLQRKKTRKHPKNDSKNKSEGQVIRLVLQLIIFFLLLAVAIGIFYFYFTYGKTLLHLQTEAKQKVSASDEDTFRDTQTSIVYDNVGNIISTLKTEKDAYYIEYEEIPEAVINAMVVSEDRNFFEHDGVDYWANIRAAIALIKHKGEITQGASTITQQLARNVFLTQDVTYERKIEEIFAAQELEKKYSKYDIMEFYLNEIYFANGHYGIQAAAKGYFGEGINALSLSQMMFLCAIPNNPNLYNPLTNIENTIKRRDRILKQMYEDGQINTAQYKEAIKETIKLKMDKKAKKDYVETYVYYSAIRSLMKVDGFEFHNEFDSKKEKEAYEKAYNELYYSYQKALYVKGYRIYTSIDLQKQELLQESVDTALEDFQEKNEEGVFKMQGAAVCIDNDSGRVVAIVGGRDQNLPGYTLNRAYQSYRQPGSVIKPLIVYTPLFERNYTPDSIVVDEYIEGGPKNSGGGYSGNMQLQRAIEQSKNTVAWKLYKELKPIVGLAYLQQMNFAKITASDNTLASALGGFTTGVSPVEMAAAYATLMNDGNYRQPSCIVRITDAEGNAIVAEEADEKRIYLTKAARIMTEALTGVIRNGTAKGLGLKNSVSAGKTGTTNDKKDGWFVGYTPYYTTSVWVGYDMPKTVKDLKGASYPGTIWHNFMDQIHTSSMKEQFVYYDWRSALKMQQEKEQAESGEDIELENSEDQTAEQMKEIKDSNMLDSDDASDDRNETVDQNSQDQENAEIEVREEEEDDVDSSDEDYDDEAKESDYTEQPNQDNKYNEDDQNNNNLTESNHIQDTEDLNNSQGNDIDVGAGQNKEPVVNGEKSTQ